MIVFGGDAGGGSPVLNTGALFDPLTFEWRPTTTQDAPPPVRKHMAAWTGREMLVWGGSINASENKTNEGAKYYPY
jgi:hypothetical protein